MYLAYVPLCKNDIQEISNMMYAVTYVTRTIIINYSVDYCARGISNQLQCTVIPEGLPCDFLVCDAFRADDVRFCLP